jgi:hypothetical protein
MVEPSFSFWGSMVAAETRPELQKLSGRHSVKPGEREIVRVDADLRSGERVKGEPPSAGARGEQAFGLRS